MGKKWDRLDGVGTGGATFSSDGMGKGFKSLPSYRGTPNPLCQNCKGSKRGQDRKGFRVCRCEAPDFPNLGAAQGSRMSAWHIQWLQEAYRVLRPGGVVKAFSGTRTFHRLAAAMAEAGFTNIHLEVWAYGSGFPKSLDISKALDKAAGAEREVISTTTINNNFYATDGHSGEAQEHHRKKPEGVKITAPATKEAKEWEGWGTALKPSWEPVLVGNKPE